jgi:hypothetical protein
MSAECRRYSLSQSVMQAPSKQISLEQEQSVSSSHEAPKSLHTHVAPWQENEPPMFVQSFPQLPQLLLSEAKSVQAEEQHPGCTPPQESPQLPQLLTSEVKSLQVPLQEISGDGHAEVPTS